MRKLVSPICLLPLTLCASLLLGGCSVIGYNVGSTLDGGKPARQFNTPSEKGYSIPWDARIEIVTTHGSIVKGAFRGIVHAPDTISEAEYAADLDLWKTEKAKDSTWIPSLGAGINVQVRAPAKKYAYTGHFAGFDRGVLKVACSPPSAMVALKVDFVDAVADSTGRLIANHEAVVRALEDGVPFTSRQVPTPAIVLDNGTEITVPLREIQTVYELKPGPGKWIGLGIGILADVAVYFMLANPNNQPRMNLGSL